jgi:hypothetical protein
MLHDFRIVRNIGMNDEVEIRQIDAARGDVGRYADAGAAIPQRLQRHRSLVLGQFARQRDHGEAALQQRRLQMPDRFPRVAEHQRARRFVESQNIDDGMLDIAGGDPDRAVLDVGMAALVACDFDTKGLLLIFLRQRDDAARQGRREQQRAALFRRGLQDEFHVFAKTEVEHLVGLVEHDRLQLRNIKATAPQMVAKPSGRTDYDVGARGELTLLTARVHAADAGNHARVRVLIEPGEFAMHLKCQFARRRDDQRQRSRGAFEPFGAVEQVVRKRQAIGDRFAGAGLCRNQQVAAGGIVGENCGLHLSQPIEVAFRQSSGERWMGGQ